MARDPVSGSTGLRVLYILGFYLCLGILELLLLLIACAQLVSVLARDQPHQDLQRFSSQLGAWLKQIAEYLGWQTAEKPWPFSPWPEADEPYGDSR